MALIDATLWSFFVAWRHMDELQQCGALEIPAENRATSREKVQSPLLTRQEACDYLRIRTTFFHQLVKEGRLKSFKLGKRQMVLRADADRLIEEFAAGPDGSKD